jgi:hypothetical protein
MKIFYLLLLAIVFFSFVIHKKTINTVTGGCNAVPDCSIDLRDSIFAIDSLTGSKVITYSKANSTFSDISYPPNHAPTCGVSTTQIVCTNDTSVLKYAAWYPAKSGCARGCIILIHGGSYSDCSNYLSPQVKLMCREFAKRGFVSISPEYRRGNIEDTNSTAAKTYYSAQSLIAVYRGLQDINGLVRSLIAAARIYNPLTDSLHIDTNYIFLAGISAGSVLAEAVAYEQSQGKIDSLFPGLHARLGSIHADYYKGDTTIEIASKIKGTLNCWGALYVTRPFASNPALFFRGDVNIAPQISFEGALDTVFNYISSNIFFSPHRTTGYDFNSESHCLDSGGTFTLNPDLQGRADLIELGARGIHSMFKGANIPCENYTDCSMHHGLDDTDGAAHYHSDFGTGDTTAAQTDVYIVQRTVIYFQAIVDNFATKLDASEFTDCENFRYGCDTSDNNAGCHDSDHCFLNQSFYNKYTTYEKNFADNLPLHNNMPLPQRSAGYFRPELWQQRQNSLYFS